jgi:hypothetical protein
MTREYVDQLLDLQEDFIKAVAALDRTDGPDQEAWDEVIDAREALKEFLLGKT